MVVPQKDIKGAMSAAERALWGYANYFQLSKFYCF